MGFVSDLCKKIADPSLMLFVKDAHLNRLSQVFSAYVEQTQRFDCQGGSIGKAGEIVQRKKVYITETALWIPHEKTATRINQVAVKDEVQRWWNWSMISDKGRP